MNILNVGDISGWAISNLIKSINKHLENRFNISTIYIHPREVSNGLMTIHRELEKGVDLIDFHYWRTATQLMDMMPKLKTYPRILSHWNHESLQKEDWKRFGYLTHPTRYGKELLSKNHPNVHHIPMGIDLSRYSYIDDETYRQTSKEIRVGYVGRVADWKNLHFICECCKELGYKVIGSGYIDKPAYWNAKVKQYQEDGTLEYNGGIGRGEMKSAIFKDNLYKRMTVLAMASEGEYESGPLPAQEAMARGIPVISTCKGTLKDRGEDGKNIVFFNENDKEDFKSKLKSLVEDEPKRMSIRKKAWETAKQYPEQRMSREFGKLYYEVYKAFHK